MMNKVCPSCRQIINTSRSRLVKDSCGHIKCRMCLIYEEQGCKICINEHSIENYGRTFIVIYLIIIITVIFTSLICFFIYCFTEKKILNNVSISDKSNICNEILPLELVINKDSKLKANNFEPISTDYINNYELYREDIINKTKEINKSSTDIKNNDTSNNLHISNIETNNALLNVYPHLSNNVVIKSSSNNKVTEICNVVSFIIYMIFKSLFYIKTFLGNQDKIFHERKIKK